MRRKRKSFGVLGNTFGTGSSGCGAAWGTVRRSVLTFRARLHEVSREEQKQERKRSARISALEVST
jgi:hypothetical protein